MPGRWRRPHLASSRSVLAIASVMALAGVLALAGGCSSAESDLRAEAATERWFDRRLARIRFPPMIAAMARALIQANQSRPR
jgi:hypothetical protein